MIRAITDVLGVSDAGMVLPVFTSATPPTVGPSLKGRSISGMIGGVYTPAPLRGRGYAKAALALHLKDAHVNGVTQAVLSAANSSAAKADTAIGFRQVGEFMIVIYNRPRAANV